jgi:hypothetical protein
MTFPSIQITTTNLDSNSDSPASARVDLLDAVQKLNLIIADGGAANGVCILNGSGQVPSSQIPANITPSANLVLAPTTNIVNIQDILRLTAQYKSDVLAISTATLATGDIAVIRDTPGVASIAFFTGVAWKYISSSTFTTLT